MTRAEALKEARRRWGPRATVQETGDPSRGFRLYCRNMEGHYPGAGELRLMGAGYSWEAAFLDSDRRERAK